MIDKDIAKMSIEEVQKLLETAKKHEQSLIDSGKNEAIKAINEQIQKFKLTAKDLTFFGAVPSNIKYKKSESETWSGGGRGKKPNWVIAEFEDVAGTLPGKATEEEKNKAFIEHMKQYLVE